MLPEQQIILRLLVSAVLGSLVGLEREWLNWVAGLRTHMLVCVGSTLLMIVSAFGFADILGNERVMLDPSQVAAQVVSGIGFLGAGTIILRREVVRGLTTAASLWSVAAVGLAVGGGLYLAAIWGTALILVILAGIKPLERRFSRARQACLLMLVIDRRELSVLDIESALEAAHLRLKHIRIQHGSAPNEDRLQIRLRRAPRPSMLSMAEQLRSLPGVREVRHTGS
jgi:putative Mg2+ transporter-C (MgtC) family protein